MPLSRSYYFTKSLYRSGKLEIKSPADEFIKYFTRENKHVSDTFPAEELSFQIKSKDLKKRMVTMSIHGNLVSERYNMASVVFIASPDTVVYTFEVEKISPDIENPGMIVDTVLEHIRFIDKNLYELNHTVNSINVEYPADECFKAFIEAFKDDVEIEIEAKDWENRTTEMSLKSSHILMTKFKTFKVTTTITPQEGANGSHVKWTIEAEKIDGISDPDLFLTTAISIRDMIKNKLRK